MEKRQRYNWMLLSGMEEAVKPTDPALLNEYLNIDEESIDTLTLLLKDTGTNIMCRYHDIALHRLRDAYTQDYGLRMPEDVTGTSEGLYEGVRKLPVDIKDVETFCERVRSAECGHFADFSPGQKDYMTGMYMIYADVNREIGYLLPCQEYIKAVDELVTSIKEYLHKSILESIEDSATKCMEIFSYYNYYGYLPEDIF